MGYQIRFNNSIKGPNLHFSCILPCILVKTYTESLVLVFVDKTSTYFIFPFMKSPLPLKISAVKYGGDFMHGFS